MILKKIKELCEERKVTIYRLEKDLGFSGSSIVKWEKSSPTADKLKAVADYFGVPMEYFYEEKEQQEEKAASQEKEVI